MVTANENNTIKPISIKIRNKLARLKKTMRPKWQKSYIFESPLTEIVSNPYDEKTITVECIHDINTLLIGFAEQRGDWYLQQAKTLFAKNNLCFVAIIDNQIVSCLWTSFHTVKLTDIEYTLNVPENVAPLIDGYTFDGYRGRGIYKILWNACHNYLVQNTKFTKIYGFINQANTRSLKVHDKLNLNKIILKIILIKFLGIRVHIKMKVQ